MRRDAGRELTCVRSRAGAAMVFAICSAVAVAQTPEQKPAESYQTFYLKNATGMNAANDALNALRNMLPQDRIYYAPSQNALSIRGTAEDIAIAQKILAAIDRPQRTYRVTYAISRDGNESEAQHFVLIVTPGSKTLSKQGKRVPIMTGANKEGEPATAQVQYMDTGLTIETSIAGFGDGLQLHSKIEESSIAEEKSNVGIQDPIVKQSVLEVQSGIVTGKPRVLGAVDLPGGHMQVQATVEQID